MQPRIIERLAGDEVDRTGDAAIDHVRRHVLEHFDAAEQFGRYVVEAQNAATSGRKDIATVQFGSHEGKAANDDASTFNREAVGVGRLFETPNVDAGDALQCFGYRPVRQCANILSGNHVHECVSIFLDALSGIQRRRKTGNNDDITGIVVSLLVLFGRLIVLLRICCRCQGSA